MLHKLRNTRYSIQRFDHGYLIAMKTIILPHYWPQQYVYFYFKNKVLLNCDKLQQLVIITATRCFATNTNLLKTSMKWICFAPNKWIGGDGFIVEIVEDMYCRMCCLTATMDCRWDSGIWRETLEIFLDQFPNVKAFIIKAMVNDF